MKFPQSADGLMISGCCAITEMLNETCFPWPPHTHTQSHTERERESWEGKSKDLMAVQ